MDGLERFVSAQSGIYEQAIAEIRAGSTKTHWMWFVFPQLAALGGSPVARRYALASLAEARDYLAHDVLGPRLIECAEAVAASHAPSAAHLFKHPDDARLHSSMTLFRRAAPQVRAFDDVLVKYFDGVPDPRTEKLLG
jgi:uncharacterized protein (DUF1810 family)